MPLPPIPVESWIADQQDLFNKTIGGLFPSLEFQDATNDAAAQIPYDYPYAGGEDSFREEQERIRQLQEEEDRRVEQERLQAEAQQQQAMAAAQQATLQQQEMARQQELQGQAQQTASQLGIPLPQDVSALFQGVSGPPGSGDHASSSGAFDPSPMAPAPTPDLEIPNPDYAEMRSPYDFRDMESGVGESLPTTPTSPPPEEIPDEPPKMGGLGDFQQYASGLWDQAQAWGERMQNPQPEYSPGVLPGPTDTERREYEEQTERVRTGRNADGTRVGQDYGFSETGQDTLTRGAGVLGALNTVTEGIWSRVDPVFQPALATDGIIETEFSDEEKRKVRTVQEKMMQVGADKPALDDQELAEAEAIQARARARYEQIKDDPDAMTKYASASPDKGPLSMALALLTLPIGGVAKGAASASATRLGASPQAARAAGYVADITAQSAVDPTNLPLQGGVDVLAHGAGPALRGARDAASTVFTPRGPLDRAVTYGRDLGGRVLEDLGEGMRSTFNLPERELSDEAQEALQKGIVPLEVRRRTTPNVLLPALDAQERQTLEEAVRNVGGTLDNEGIHFGVTRAYNPEATDVISTRGGTFEEPISPGGQSSFIAPNGASVGGTEQLPRTPTTYRAPLIVQSRRAGSPGDHVDDALRQLGVQGEATPELKRILERIKRREMAELIEDYDNPAPGSLDADEMDADLRRISRSYDHLMRRWRNTPVPRQVIDELAHTLEEKFKAGSPKHQAAMQEVLKSFGGRPDLLEDIRAVKAAGSDIGWILNENLISEYGRKQGRDGMIVLRTQNGVPTISEIMDFQVSHIPTVSGREFNPAWVTANEQVTTIRKQLRKLHTQAEQHDGVDEKTGEFLTPFNPAHDQAWRENLSQQIQDLEDQLGDAAIARKDLPKYAEGVSNPDYSRVQQEHRAATETLKRFQQYGWGEQGDIPHSPERKAVYEARVLAARQALQDTPEFSDQVAVHYRLHPELDPDGTLSRVPGQKGAIAARKLPLAGSVRQGYRRLFHGGRVGNEDIDPTQFDAVGAYGPAHYLTTSDEVAEHYFRLGSGYDSETGIPGVIRPTDLDDRAMLYDASKPLPQGDLGRIADAMDRRVGGQDQGIDDLIEEYRMLALAPRGQYPRIDAQQFYDELHQTLTPPDQWRSVEMGGEQFDIGDKRLANEILKDAGFDGIYYRGEPTVRSDVTGRHPQHSAVAIFPESMDSLRNGLTGELRGARGGPARVGEAESYALRSLPTRSVVGGAGGAVAGYNAGDENTTPEERLKNTVVGGVLGSVGAQKGTLASARLVDSLISRGVLSSEILARHPVTPARIQALYALASRNLQDDDEVAIPGMVGLLTKLEPEQRQAVEELINGPKTAGEIRAILGQMADPTDLGREAQTLLTDLLAGTGIRGARASETRADRATLEGITDRNPFAALDTEVERGAARISTPHGPAVRLPEDGATTQFVHTVADELGVPRPTVYLSGHPEPGAFASTGKGDNSVILTKGLANLDLTADEMRALITHELAHTTEQSFGADLIGRAFRKLDESFGQTAEELAGAVKVPRRGVWKERVEQGPEIPPTATARQTNEIQRQYDEAMRLLEKSQQPRLKAKNQIRYISQAHDVWEKYDAAVQAAKKATGAAPESRPRATPTRDRVPVPDQETAGLPDDAAFPFGRTAADAEPVAPRRDIPLTPDEVADDLAFDANPLPDVFDPSERIDHADIGRLITQLNEELALDPKLQSQMQAASVRLMGMPKPRAKHIQDFVEKIGERRAVPRGMTQTEAGQAWADRFFRKNGWLASDTVEPAVSGETAEAVLRNTGENLEDLAARADEGLDLAEDAEGPTDAILRELSETDLDDIEELTDMAVEDMPGIIGKRRVNPRLQQNATLNADPGVNALLHPNAGKSHRGRTAFESIHDFWREKVVPKVSDEMAILQGFQNDLAREYLEQTGTKIPHDVLAAELKRLDAGRRAEMEVNRGLKPALQTFRRLELPMEHVNNYLAYQHQLDVATQQGNFTRNVPGGADLADAQQWVDDFEKIYRAELGPQRYAEFEKAVDQVWDFGQSLLDEKLSAGLINQADYNAMRQAYPRYVPTRILNYLDDENRVGLGKSLSVNDNLIREMTYQGTQKEALSPLAAMIGDAYSTYATGQKNRVFNALVDLQSIGRSLNLPNTARGQRIQTVLDAMQPMFNPNNAAPKNAVSMSGFINGTKQKYMVDKAIGDMTNFESPTTIPFLGAAMSAFRAGATARNPVFLTANMMLDFSNYMIREAAREGGPQALPKVIGEYLKVAAQHLPIGAMTGTGVGGYLGGQTVNEDDTMLSAAAKIGAGAVGGAAVGMGADRLTGNKAIREMLRNEYSGGMEEFLQQGGGTAGAYFERAGLPVEPIRMKIGPRGGTQVDVDSIVNALGYRKESAIEGQVGKLQQGAIEIKSPQDLWRAMKELTAKDVLTKAKDAVLLKPVEKLGERIELVPRVAAMNLAKKRGESMVEAVNKGRTTTTDFNKGGTLSRFVNQFVPFFNVGVQGTADIGRAFEQNPKAFTAMLGTSIVGPVAAAEVWNTSDPQMRKDYEDVPDYIKDQGLVVMLPESLVGKYPVDAQGNRHPQFFHFRYRNFAPFAILTREFMKRTLTDRDMPEEDRRGMLDQFLGAGEQLSPIGIGSAQEFGTSVLPPVMGTIAQLGFDQDTFRGRRIKSKQADERASPLSKALADRTGMGTAAQWEFATRDIGTGYAGMVHGLSDIVAGTERTRKTSPQERPLTGGLYGRIVKGSIGGVAERETDQGGNWLSQSQLVTPSAEKLLQERGIKWRPGPTDPEVRDVPLTRSEYGEHQKNVNRAVDEAIHRTLSNPRVQALSVTKQQEIVQRAVTRAKEVERRKTIKDIGRDQFRDRRRIAVRGATTA